MRQNAEFLRVRVMSLTIDQKVIISVYICGLTRILHHRITLGEGGVCGECVRIYRPMIKQSTRLKMRGQ